MFVWRWLGSEGLGSGTSGPFPDREAAESWLAESWAELHERGVEQVELADDVTGAVLYRMSLAGE